MTDFLLLNEVIKKSGMPMTTIATRSGIRRETLYNRLKGKGEFTASEISALTNVFHLTKAERDKIFFAQKVALNDT